MRPSKIIQSIREFLVRNDGASGIEYAIIAAMVAVIIAGFVTAISGGVSNVFTTIQGVLP
ncbi:MAG: Flp family type IVb pilin [Pseudomonas sp.]|uniref:Flp family type IVb pilin n=1 Tax=Pseudomonas sp. TaxID=306 RepID=UPI003D0D17BE